MVSIAAARDVRRVEVEQLYRSLHASLERIVCRQVQVHGAETVIEDACQMAWSQLAQHVGTISIHHEHVLAWLVTTARREALRLLRLAERECPLEDGPEGCELPGGGFDEQPQPTELFEQRERLRSLAALSRRQRRLLLLQAAGYSYREIAQRTGESLRSVERQMLRARRTARRLAA